MTRVATIGLVLACAGCGDLDPAAVGPAFDSGDVPFETLSEYGFFEGPLADLQPAPAVIPYTVSSPLWADAADKGRFFWIPEGGKIGLQERDPWTFPDGTIFIKNFLFDQDRRGKTEDLRVIETRLLVSNAGQWDSHIYVWDEAQQEAERIVAGADVTVEFIDETGAPGSQLYLVPDRNTCESCHQREDDLVLLGPITGQLNTGYAMDGMDGPLVNQIDWLRERGMFEQDPAPSNELEALVDPAGDASVEARARSYLHGNCAHCHRPGGDGGASGLSFLAWEEDPAKYGVCKVPSAAGGGAGGRRFDITPGSPDTSIVVFRMASTDPEIKMPELPSLLADPFGVELVSAWISEMPEVDCSGG